jgi:hypothetical protein
LGFVSWVLRICFRNRFFLKQSFLKLPEEDHVENQKFGFARGIPRAIHSGEIRQDYICSLCMEVLNDPYQCKDGHLNCKERWNDLVLKTGPECTLCRTEVYGLNDLSKCLLVRRQIAALPIVCRTSTQVMQAVNGPVLLLKEKKESVNFCFLNACMMMAAIKE